MTKIAVLFFFMVLIAVFRVDQTMGGLTPIQRVNMLPDEFRGDNQAADIHISTDEKFLYASNRTIPLSTSNRAHVKDKYQGWPSRISHGGILNLEY